MPTPVLRQTRQNTVIISPHSLYEPNTNSSINHEQPYSSELFLNGLGCELLYKLRCTAQGRLKSPSWLPSRSASCPHPTPSRTPNLHKTSATQTFSIPSVLVGVFFGGVPFFFLFVCFCTLGFLSVVSATKSCSECSQAWWLTPVTLAHRRLRQDYGHRVQDQSRLHSQCQASLGQNGSLY